MQGIQVKFNHITAEFYAEIRHRFQNIEHLYYSSWGQTRLIWTTLDSESLTRARLAIRKYTHVVTINSLLY